MPAEPSQSVEEVTIRRARPEDAQSCGRICYEAFHKINTDHGFPPELPEAGVAVDLLSMMFSYARLLVRRGGAEGSNHRQQLPG